MKPEEKEMSKISLIDSTQFQVWFALVPLAYVFFVGFFRTLGWWPGKARAGSRLSDIMAYEIVAGLIVTYVGVAGSYGWYEMTFNENSEFYPLQFNKFYGMSQFFVDHLMIPMLSYQVWNVVLCFVLNDLYEPFFIGHHTVTASLAYFGTNPYVHYYGLFFFGIAELTNVPLTFYDVFKYFPDLKAKYSMVNEVSKVVFALSFIFLRLVIWPFISFEFWRDSIKLVQSGEAHSNFVVIFFLLANFFLTGLQFMWGSKIFGFLFQKPSKKENTKTK